MTEEELVVAIQQKEQEKIESKLEEKKAYRDCLLKCAEQRSSFKRLVYFYTHYVVLLTSFCLLFVLYFLLVLLVFFVVKNSFQALGAVSIVLPGFAFLVTTLVLLRSKYPFYGLSYEGIYEELQWANREIKELEERMTKNELSTAVTTNRRSQKVFSRDTPSKNYESSKEKVQKK